MHRWGGASAFPSVITVFSAPNYCGQVGNDASVMKIDNLACSFITLKPIPKKKKIFNTKSVPKK